MICALARHYDLKCLFEFEGQMNAGTHEAFNKRTIFDLPAIASTVQAVKDGELGANPF